MPLIEPLLNLGCRFAPLPSFLWMTIYWIDSYLQILPTVIFLLSVSSLHICPLSYMVIVLIPYTSSAYGKEVHPVGKSYASKVDDEKWLFLGGANTKNPAIIIIAWFFSYGRAAGIIGRIT